MLQTWGVNEPDQTRFVPPIFHRNSQVSERSMLGAEMTGATEDAVADAALDVEDAMVIQTAAVSLLNFNCMRKELSVNPHFIIHSQSSAPT